MKINVKLSLVTLCIFALLQCRCGSENQGEKTDKGKIVAVEDWEKAIIGTWKYNMLLDKVREKQAFEGEIEYKNDGTFIRTVTIFVHFTDNGEVEISKGYEEIISGGTVKGKWKVDKENQLLIENSESCTISNSFVASWANKEYDGCVYFAEFVFGNKQTDDWKGELLELSEKNIRAKSKQFSSNANLTYEASKQ
jgi:hypothetical protein